MKRTLAEAAMSTPMHKKIRPFCIDPLIFQPHFILPSGILTASFRILF
jgi:hypothetical protein